MTKADLYQKWASIIAEYKSSGQTQTSFCKSAGISLRQLSYWLRKERQNGIIQSESPKWIPVEVDHKEHTGKGQSIEIKFGPAEVQVKPGFDQKHLLDVLMVLRELC
ncbi:hypothetical protein CDQ84_19230 [Clostridium thermosuccinogenes]|jgi:hypothetical protein|uniref:Transposase n=1 Tax=Clostridium thermosuccinogenes TaxID=84032 RepID=A0A2K2EUQ5_9CLOT|nr:MULTISPECIES: hypothetical protein [Clostridia]AUS95247.1 hypothetical protein CDO33_01575 [Pseudoclostridium thermosuccinogenes]AUS96068.1 hypothetical protein CDO33_06225 [Pseudoclostridium thermosuccinogenes]AUS96093.1 hypothetical protein CDO33_06365 [Pseudoclostridium thermosuccinogenes]AUS97160.1 hypothetical protein CDO33_12360 [Pseudoclostridium thermosuccinogenes]AUS97247.1 hypothetical protein CDO33_12850 [Pseudoclostridium thermosuccinogenes]